MNAVADLKFPEIIDPVMPTEKLAAIASEVVDLAEFKDGKAVVTYSHTEAALADLRKRYAGAKFDLTTTKGDKAARDARLELVTLRTALEKKRKAFKSPALEFGKLIDTEAARITAEIAKLEEPIDAQIKADEKRRADEKAERERIEAERVAAHKAAIARIRSFIGMAEGLPAARIKLGIEKLEAMAFGDECEDHKAQYEAARDETLASLRKMHSDTLAREEEEARLEAQRQEQARIAAEQARVAAELAEKQRQLAEQAAELERQRRAADEAAERARAEQEEKQRAAAQATEAPATDTCASAGASTEAVGTEVTPGSGQPEASPHDEACARFDHHPDPAIDFCLEVEAIENELVNENAGLPLTMDIDQRIAAALEFRVGGDQAAIAAKALLRDLQITRRDTSAQQEAGQAAAQGTEANPSHCQAQPSLSAIDPDDMPLETSEADARPWSPSDGYMGPADAEDPPPAGTDLELAAMALTKHIAKAFDSKFPSQPKPSPEWWAELRRLACGIDAVINDEVLPG